MAEPDDSHFLLWCRVCRQATLHKLDDADGFRRDGWPRCCDETMTVYTRAYRDRGELPTVLEPTPRAPDAVPG
jgi:hypothetical protein